jgi:hypothetical protein
LEGKLKRDNEWVVDESQNRTLRQNVGNFSRALSYVGLSDCFQGIDSLCVLLPNLHNLSEAAFSYDFEEIKRLDRERFIPAWFEIYFEMERARTRSSRVPLVRRMLCGVFNIKPRGNEAETYMTLECRGEVHSSQQHVISHVVLALCSSGSQIG